MLSTELVLVLKLLECDTQNLENQIFPQGIEEYSDLAGLDTIFINKAKKKSAIDDRKIKDIQRNESLDKYRYSLLSQILVFPDDQV